MPQLKVVTPGDILSQRKAKMKKRSNYSGYGTRTSSAAYGYKTKDQSPQKTVNMVRPEYPGSYMPKKKSGGVNQFDIAAGNAKDKKKAGATTGAAHAGGTGAKTKRKSWFQRRMAERYAIGSSGKSL